MSEGLPPGSLSLEPDPDAGGTPVGIVTDPAVPIDPNAQTPPTDADPEPEGTVVVTPGQKMVPLPALQAVREENKATKAALAERDAKIAELSQKADRFDAAEQYLRDVQPVIEAVRARPDLIALAKQPPAPAQEPAGPLNDQQAEEYAKYLDLYTADGKPDTGRAQRIAKLNQAVVQSTVNQAVQPFAQQSAQQQAAGMKSRLLTMKDAPSQASIDKVYASLPPELAALPEVANLAFFVAKGMDAVNTPQKVTPPPVVPTESVGGSVKVEPTITDLDRRFMEAAGLTKKQFEEGASRFKPGQYNSLE